MKDIDKQKENLYRLIESWQEENIDLALQLAETNRTLLKALRGRYMPLVRMVGGHRLKQIKEFPQRLPYNAVKAANNIPYDEQYLNLFKHLPCKTVQCSYAKLKEIPWWILEMKNLEILELNRNEIEEIPPAIGNLTKLQILQLNNNQIKKLPDEMSMLRDLGHLQLDFNQIEVVPKWIGQLHKLSWLCLEANPIEALPEELLSLELLSWVSVEKSPLGERHNIHHGFYTSSSKTMLKQLITDG